jgi:SAM-dependent methyltransferase
VLDVGCGTGEHTLMCAALGLDTTGIDLAPRAISAAQAKASERGLTARFLHHDALRLAELGESFDTVLDSLVFHVFGDDERAAYVDSLRAATKPGGRLFLLCFSDRQPGAGEYGPRRVTREEIAAAFADGWKLDSITAAAIDNTLIPDGVLAWLAALTRIRPSPNPERTADADRRSPRHDRTGQPIPRPVVPPRHPDGPRPPHPQPAPGQRKA